jgi:DNA repair protein RecN (Recombination protein N)
MSAFYLKQLIIQNFATFKNQTIHFSPGFNAIIGETGSGKSLVLDALQLILGGRADKKIVRKDSDYSLIEASFHCCDKDISSFLASEGYPLEGAEVIIKRMIYKNGTTRNFINHLSCTLGFLNTFAKKYIDLVGQFENQKLLSEGYQLYLLDQFSKISPQLKEYSSLWKEYNQTCSRIKELHLSKTERDQKLDYINYQLQEIETLNPSSHDEESLIRQKDLLVNHERNQKVFIQVKALYEGEELQDGVSCLIDKLKALFIKNRNILTEEVDDILKISDLLQELYCKIERKSNIDHELLQLDGVIERIDLYQKVKKKFGGTLEGVLKAREEFMLEHSKLTDLEINLEQIQKKQSFLESELKNKAKDLHNQRMISAQKLSELLTQKVRSLKMTGATIELAVEQLDQLNEQGCSNTSFLAETNIGEGFFKIKDIASGGELSRILLSVRQILSACDSISIFLFDEIDTGIGGETASHIGKALKEVASNGQVIAITHLPQIAQFAETLISVHKDIRQFDSELRTESHIKEIKGKFVLKEVRAMASLS